MRINAKRVQEIFIDCLFTKDEIVGEKPELTPVITYGVVMNVGFNPVRLEKHTEEIYDIIDELPEGFSKGWSFLNLCYDKDEVQWTGSHRTMEELMLLGLATNKFKYTCDRSLWDMLPGCMPYLFNIKREDIRVND